MVDKKRIYCYKCDEFDGIKYLGHDHHDLFFECDYCPDNFDPDRQFQIAHDVEWHIPKHIPVTQWNKYISKTIYIRNWRWYET